MLNQFQQRYHGQNTNISDSRMSKKSKTSSDSGVGSDLDFDYRPMKIIVFRNGDKFDPGTEVSITRKEFKQWTTFLDALTKKIHSLTAVHKLFALNGREVEDFKDLDYGRPYVASSTDSVKLLRYGEVKPRKWALNSKTAYKDPSGLQSVESLDIYLKKMGFESQTSESSYRFFPKTNKKRNGNEEVNGTVQKMLNPELRVRDKTVSLPKIYVTKYQNNSKTDKMSLVNRCKPQRSFSEERIAVGSPPPRRNEGTGNDLKNEKTSSSIRHLEVVDGEIEYPFVDDVEDLEDGYYNYPPNVSYYNLVSKERAPKPTKDTFYA